MTEWLAEDLGAIDVAVLALDRLHIHGRFYLVARGIDRAGKLHVLGVRQHPADEPRPHSAFVADLCEHGLTMDRAILVIIGGERPRRVARVALGSRARARSLDRYRRMNARRRSRR